MAEDAVAEDAVAEDRVDMVDEDTEGAGDTGLEPGPVELVELGPESNGHQEPPHEEPVLHEPLLTLGQASRATGVSKDTLRRRLKAGRLPNASRSDHGTWLVPVTDLLAAGLDLDGDGKPAETVLASVDDPGPLGSMRAELERLRNENALLRERLAMTEIIATERQERIEDLRLALRMLPEVWAERMLASTQPPAAIRPAPRAAALRSDGAARSDPAMDVWVRESTPSTMRGSESGVVEAGADPLAKIHGLQLALEAERAENERLSAEVSRRRWWPFRRTPGKHRRGTNTPPY